MPATPGDPTTRVARPLVGPGAAEGALRILAFGGLGLALGGCAVHISKNGISGNILGHSFSGATGALPAGFPSDIPVPDRARVLAGGGTNGRWDAAFAVAGLASAGTGSYEAKLRVAGYTLSNIETGSAPLTAAGTGSTSTTVTVSGTVFVAHDSQWTLDVASGSTTSPTEGGLKPGEFAINVTAVPTSSITTSST